MKQSPSTLPAAGARDTRAGSIRMVAFLVLVQLTAAGSFADTAGAARDITWDDLLPDGWVPPAAPIDHFFDAAPPVAAASGDAPVVAAMNQQRVRLPGYLVPLEVDGEKLVTFLMVPYFGACIHVPPPPPNQVVFVRMAQPVALDDPYGAHWVTGVVSTLANTTDLAEASYTMSGELVEIFDWDALYDNSRD